MRRRLRLALFAVLLSAGSSAVAVTPEASRVAESDRLLNRALDLREAGNDRDALPLLVQAALFDPTPRKRAQLALGEQAMGEWVEAERGLASALDAKLDPWIAEHRGPLEDALATVRRQLGWLEVDGNVPGAQVTLNGMLVGTLPLQAPVRVTTGVSSLKVVAPGYTPTTRLVQVAAGEHAREVVALRAEVAPAAPIASAPPVVAPPRRPGPGGRAAAWATLGGSAAFLATGIGATAARNGDAAQYNQEAQRYNAQCTSGGCPMGARPSHTDVDVLTGVSVAAYAVSAALAVTGGVLLWRSAPAPSTSSARSSVHCSLGLLTVKCGGEF